MARTRVKSRAITNAVKDVRKYLSLVGLMAAEGDQQKAYSAAEAAQMTAFDLKALIDGSADIYVPGQNAPEWVN